MREMWRRFGCVPALLVFVVLYAVALPVALLLDDPVDEIVAVVLFGVYIVYCVARPSHRADVFFYAAVPGALGTLLHDLFDISRLWGLVALPITLSALRDIDRKTVAGEDASPSLLSGYDSA